MIKQQIDQMDLLARRPATSPRSSAAASIGRRAGQILKDAGLPKAILASARRPAEIRDRRMVADHQCGRH
jgi:hypothetical protein